jgi:ankyrin repeat protein
VHPEYWRLMFVTSHTSDRLWWAQFQIGQILSLGAESDVKKSLGRLPQSLEDLYEDAYERIQTEPGQGPGIALKTLMWVMCAFEPCSPDELAKFVFLNFPQEERLTGHVLLKLCHNLLTIDQQSDVVKIAHPSIRDFLENKYAPMVDSHILVAKTCLAFLSGPNTLRKIDLDDYASKYPVMFWPMHVQACLDQQKDAELSEQLIMFLNTHSKDWYKAYADLFDTYRIPNSERTFEYRMPEPGKFHEFERGLEKILIDSLEELKFDELTPWHIAAVYEFGEQLEALWVLEPPNINAVNKHGHTMLFIASSNGSSWIVERLLKKGADPNVSCAGMMALDSAAFHGRYEIVQLLLDYGGDAKGERWEVRSALCWAAVKDFHMIVQLLLENGANPNIRCTYKKWSALYAASSLGRCEVVKLLLENGGDAGAEGGDEGSALGVAVRNGWLDVVKLLREHMTLQDPAGTCS